MFVPPVEVAAQSPLSGLVPLTEPEAASPHVSVLVKSIGGVEVERNTDTPANKRFPLVDVAVASVIEPDAVALTTVEVEATKVTAITAPTL